MRRHGRVTMRQDDPAADAFRRIAGDDRANPIICAFEMKDSDPGWDTFQALAAEHGKDLVLTAEFAKAEVRGADWCLMQPTWHHGYPQPEDSYKDVVFDTSSACATCGVGVVQRAPFRMRTEPRWGRRSIMQMFWVYDAYFVRPETFTDVFESFEVSAREVLRKSGAKLDTVVQLRIDQTARLDEYRTEGERCPDCGAFKLHAGLSDFAPRPVGQPTAALALSDGWYGSGGSAFREVLVRADLVAAITAAGLRGVSFVPCRG